MTRKQTMSAIPATPCKKRPRTQVLQEPNVEEWLAAPHLSLLGYAKGMKVLSTDKDLLELWASCPSTKWSVCYTGPNNNEGLPEHLQVESNIIVCQQAGL